MKPIIMQTKFIFLLLSLFLCIRFYAQDFAYVSDPDGYVNVRSDFDINSEIVDTLPNGSIVATLNEKGNWVMVDYHLNAADFHFGIVYKDRLKYISDFQEIPVKSELQNSITLANKDISITISSKKFDKDKHTFTYVDNAPDQILEIDNEPYFGLDGGMPHIQYDTIEIQMGNKNVRLPKKATFNLYEPNLFSSKAYFDEKNDTLYIEAMNSDGAGSYLILWVIQNGKYVDRYLAYGF